MIPKTDTDATSSKRRLLLAGMGLGIGVIATGTWAKFKFSGDKDFTDATTPSPKTTNYSADKKLTENTLARESDAEATALVISFTRAWFLPYLQSNFNLIPTDKWSAAIPLKLVDVSAESIVKSPSASYTFFSVLFETDNIKDVAPSSIYRLQHDKLGAMDVFLSAVGHSSYLVQYEVVFSQKAV